MTQEAAFRARLAKVRAEADEIEQALDDMADRKTAKALLTEPSTVLTTGQTKVPPMTVSNFDDGGDY